jgi:thioredoxin reductase (NADPH)
MARNGPSDDMPWDCLIVGGGPAGLVGATYLGRFRRRVLVLDAGRSRARAIPESHNHPGFAGISGSALLQRMSDQAARYGAVLRRAEVRSLSRSKETFVAETDGDVIGAHRVLLATGLTDASPSMPGLEAAVAGALVRYCPVCDGYEASDKAIAVCGPAKEAIAKALFLRTYSRSVTLLPSEEADLASAAGKAQEAGIEVLPGPPWQLEANPSGIRVKLRNGEERRFDVLYPALGCDVHSRLATVLGARCNADGLLEVDGRQRTSIEGLYAAGDVVSDLHQLSVAEGHAAVAATAIHNSLPANLR